MRNARKDDRLLYWFLCFVTRAPGAPGAPGRPSRALRGLSRGEGRGEEGGGGDCYEPGRKFVKKQNPGLQAAALHVAGLKAAGLQVAALHVAGLKAARVGLQTAGLQAARFALQAAAWTWAVCAKGRKLQALPPLCLEWAILSQRSLSPDLSIEGGSFDGVLSRCLQFMARVGPPSPAVRRGWSAALRLP